MATRIQELLDEVAKLKKENAVLTGASGAKKIGECR
jgi:hypothetical protein